MAKITQIKLPNNEVYDILDSTALHQSDGLTEEELQNIWDEIMSGGITEETESSE